jgi:predicted glycosyltransferase
MTIADYEHAQRFLNPTWVMMPEIIEEASIRYGAEKVLRYPGIKEDVYVPFFRPDPGIKNQMGLQDKDLVVTIRPPATEAHYHNPKSEELFSKVVELLANHADARMVILPRNDNQKTWITRKWSQWIKSGKIIIPEKVLDGLNLLWHSDLVISGGGTMNREAAALGVPVYSIFRGKIGAVDRYLVKSGRLDLLESVDDVEKKLVVEKRVRKEEDIRSNGTALKDVVEGILKALGNGR